MYVCMYVFGDEYEVGDDDAKRRDNREDGRRFVCISVGYSEMKMGRVYDVILQDECISEG